MIHQSGVGIQLQKDINELLTDTINKLEESLKKQDNLESLLKLCAKIKYLTKLSTDVHHELHP